jgi:hypothetical protein
VLVNSNIVRDVLVSWESVSSCDFNRVITQRLCRHSFKSVSWHVAFDLERVNCSCVAFQCGLLGTRGPLNHHKRNMPNARSDAIKTGKYWCDSWRWLGETTYARWRSVLALRGCCEWCGRGWQWRIEGEARVKDISILASYAIFKRNFTDLNFQNRLRLQTIIIVPIWMSGGHSSGEAKDLLVGRQLYGSHACNLPLRTWIFVCGSLQQLCLLTDVHNRKQTFYCQYVFYKIKK